MSAKNIILSLVFGILIFVIGAGLGVLYKSQPTTTQDNVAVQNMPASIKTLSSKVVSAISAYGKITKISDRSITLSNENDSATIEVASDAKIYSLSVTTPIKGKPPVSTSKPIDFTKVAVGDTVSVNLKVLSGGLLQAFSVIVLPAPATPAAQ